MRTTFFYIALISTSSIMFSARALVLGRPELSSERSSESSTWQELSSRMSTMSAESRQFASSQFSLAATRFIVMLPFLPLLFAVPGATAVALPLFMAMQDRLKTIIPNLPTLIPGPGQGSVIPGGPVVPTTAKPARFHLFKRSLPSKVSEKFKDVLHVLYKTDDVINQLTSSEPDCRRQAVCRLHQSVNPTVGNFLGNMMHVLKLESQVEKLDLSTTTRDVLKDVLKAASSGLHRQDCASVYSKCSIAVPPNKV